MFHFKTGKQLEYIHTKTAIRDNKKIRHKKKQEEEEEYSKIEIYTQRNRDRNSRIRRSK